MRLRIHNSNAYVILSLKFPVSERTKWPMTARETIKRITTCDIYLSPNRTLIVQAEIIFYYAMYELSKLDSAT